MPISLSVKRTVPGQLSAAASLTLKTATVGVGGSTGWAIIKSRQSPCGAGALVGGGWRRRGDTDCHTSDIGHWFAMTEGSGSLWVQSALGMTALRAGGAADPASLVIARSEATRQSVLLYSGDGFPRQCAPQGYLLRGEHWLGMTARGGGGTSGTLPTTKGSAAGVRRKRQVRLTPPQLDKKKETGGACLFFISNGGLGVAGPVMGRRRRGERIRTSSCPRRPCR